MTKDLIKQDLNFLENPLWFQDEKLAEIQKEGFVWGDSDRFIYRAGYKVPVKTDVIFLLYFLFQSQKKSWATEIKTTRYHVLKECGLSNSTFWYSRLEDSLERWKMVGLKFQGTFYDGKSYTSMNFGILDAWEIDEETNELRVFFSSRYLQKIQETIFFRYINFDEIKALHSPLATRVYEIVGKMFQGRSFWKIDCVKFAEKIPLNRKYPADIIPKIKTAVNRINEKTSLKLKLHIRPNGRGKAFIGFEKLSANAPVELQPPITAGLPEDDEFKRLVLLIPPPENTKKTILEAVARTFKRHGFEYVARNIRYTTQQAKKNYRAYLYMALKEDLGRGWAEDQEANEKTEEIRASEEKAANLKKQQEMEAILREKEETQAALAKFETLPQEQQDSIRNAAIETLKEPIKTSVLERKIGWKIILNSAIKGILTASMEMAQEAGNP